MATKKALEEFVEQIARMMNESEMEGGGTGEDYIATLNDLIARARKITGIDPMHPKVYCIECSSAVEYCECNEDDQDDEDTPSSVSCGGCGEPIEDCVCGAAICAECRLHIDIDEMEDAIRAKDGSLFHAECWQTK